MKYVLDSSVALKFVLPEPDSGRAVQLRDEYRNGIHALLAPDIFLSEIANGLVWAEVQARIKPGDAVSLLNDLLFNAPAILPSSPLLIRGMEIALASRHALYDCLYVALAEQQNCEFVTADDRMVKALHRSFPFVLSLASLP